MHNDNTVGSQYPTLPQQCFTSKSAFGYPSTMKWCGGGRNCKAVNSCLSKYCDKFPLPFICILLPVIGSLMATHTLFSASRYRYVWSGSCFILPGTHWPVMKKITSVHISASAQALKKSKTVGVVSWTNKHNAEHSFLRAQQTFEARM